MITVTNILCSLVVFVTSVSPKSSPNLPQIPPQSVKIRNHSVQISDTFHHVKLLNPSRSYSRMLTKRHTPFLPGDHWKGMRPDFGPTETDIEVMVNGTAKMKCPITHVSDNRVSKIFCSHLCRDLRTFSKIY